VTSGDLLDSILLHTDIVILPARVTTFAFGKS
jgi:hypothetical protein